MEDNKDDNISEKSSNDNEKQYNDDNNDDQSKNDQNDNDDDLEDGEIESDDDGGNINNDDDEPIITAVIKNDNVTTTSNDNKSVTIDSTTTKKRSSSSDKVNDKNVTLKTDNLTKIDLTLTDDNKSSKSSNSNKVNIDVIIQNKKSKNRFVDDDWAGNIENAIAAALKKEGVILPKTTTTTTTTDRERDREILSDDEGTGLGGSVDGDISRSRSSKVSKKRKKRDSEKRAKKKMKYHDDVLQNDDIDDYEMICIRGGSPPPFSSHHRPQSQHLPTSQYYDSDNSYSSYDSYDSQEYKTSSYQDRRQQRKLKDRRRKINDRDDRKRGGGEKRKRNDDRDDGGVCIPFMRGYCPNGDDCTRSHDCRGQRKLELCKFYLMECCAKKDKCSYMHSDFPCKYYYLGMECIYKGACKFSHGKPLTEQLRSILLKHIETAPKEILGNFRRISREHALTLLNATHAKLCAEQGIENTLAVTQTTQSIVTVNSNMMIKSPNRNEQNSQTIIPSLLDMVIKPPTPSPRKDDKLLTANKSDKQRKSRWCDTSNDMLLSMTPTPSTSSSSVSTNSNLSLNTVTAANLSSKMPSSGNSLDILSLRNLTGVISSEQIDKLAAMGIKNLEQVNQLTVAQLNSLGLTISQINEIQLNALNIQKLGLIKTSTASTSPATSSSASSSYLGNLATSASSSSPSSSSVLSMSNRQQSGNTLEFVNPGGLYSDPSSALTTNPVQDIDMRFLIGSTTTETKRSPSPKVNLASTGIASPDAIQPVPPRAMNDNVNGCTEASSSSAIDYSQYLKDSNLDADKTDLNDISLDKDDGLNEDEPELLIDESWMDPNEDDKDLKSDDQKDDVNDDSDSNNKKSSSSNNDNLTKLSSPDMWITIKTPLITNMYKDTMSSRYDDESDEENWDTDDNDENSLSKSKSKRKDISINDTEEGYNSGQTLESREFRDPRLHKAQQQNITSTSGFGDYLNTATITSSSSNINDSIFGNASNNENNFNDNWLTATSTMKSSNATSLDDEIVTGYQRASIYDGNPRDLNGDDDSIPVTRKKCDKDMRMSSFIDATNSDIDLRLPFKPVMTNYTPATEIDGSISSHTPIPYKVVEVDIPKPDYSEIRRSIPVSDKTLDPRLRRIFCLKESVSNVNDLGGIASQNDMQFSCSNRNSSNLIASNRSNNSIVSNNSSLLQKHDDLLEKMNNSGGSSAIVSAITINSNTGGNNGPRVDPRRRKESQDNILSSGSANSSSNNTDKNQGVDIRLILQKSNWYKNLNSKYKIMVNQQLALVSTELKKFHQDTSPNKVFDMNFIATNQYLQQILTNLCIYIDSNGQIRQLEGDNDGDGTSAMPVGMIGMTGMAGMDPNVAASNVQQMANANAAGLMMQSVNGPQSQLTNMLTTMPGAAAAAAAGMYMRGTAQSLNIHGGASLMAQFRPQRYDNIRPGLLGIAPGIQFNPYESSGGNEVGDVVAGYGGAIGGEDQTNFNAFANNGAGGAGNLFNQNNFFGREDLSSTNNRGMRNNFRQGNNNGGGSGRNNQGNSSGNSGNSRRNFENKNRSGDSRRDKSQKL